MVTEAIVRESLTDVVLTKYPGLCGAYYEFWVPKTNERADVVTIGASLWGFEIKTARDTLTRLPRQVEAYGRLFDRCAVVVAERHLDTTLALVPDWWGVAVIVGDSLPISFRLVRQPRRNQSVDPETLVRLLWRKEVRAILSEAGVEPDARASRASMWQELLITLDVDELKQVVREALLGRDGSMARSRSSGTAARTSVSELISDPPEVV